MWRNFIGGEWREGRGDHNCRLVDPATEDFICLLPTPTTGEVEEAVAAAQSAFQHWKRVPPVQRAALLDKAAMLLRERSAAIAQRLVRETGKPFKHAIGEIENGAQYLRWFAEESKRVDGSLLPQRSERELAMVRFEPVGVVAALPAWNFPVALTCRKLGPAIAAGCSVIVKPAPEGSGSVVELISCFADAGAPPGLINLLLGDAETITKPLLADPRVRKLSFTGSTAVGRKVMAAAAATIKRCSLELGGHAPVIIFDDIDARSVGAASAQRKFANAGQICVSPSRFYVHRNAVEPFLEGFIEAAQQVKLGRGADAEFDMGPLINARRLAAVEQLVERSRNSGSLLLGGKRSNLFDKGYFYEPTLFADVSDDSPLMHEEIFGPVAPVRCFEDMDEVISLANGLEYGLASFVFTHDHGRAHKVSAAFESGLVGINTFIVGMPEAPYGGAKQSGFGSEGGRLGIMDYVYPKLTVHNLGQ